MPVGFCARSLPGARCFYANISFLVFLCVFYSAVIFIIRWKDSSLLLIVVCLYDQPIGTRNSSLTVLRLRITAL